MPQFKPLRQCVVIACIAPLGSAPELLAPVEVSRDRMPKLEIHQFACLNDNYGVLIHDAEAGVTASIDAPDAARDPRRASRPRAGGSRTF